VGCSSWCWRGENRFAYRRRWWLADRGSRAQQQRAGYQQARAGNHQGRLQAATQVAAHRGQQRAAQLTDGEAGGQQPGAALIAVGRDLTQALHHQHHARQERRTAEQNAQRQAPAVAQQAGKHAGRLQPQGGHQPAAGGVRVVAAQAHAYHANGSRQTKAWPEQIRLPGAVELRAGHLRQKGGRNDVAQTVQKVDPAQVRDALIAAGTGSVCDGGHRLRQERQDCQQHDQRHQAIHQPQHGRALSQQVRAQSQQTGQQNPQPRPCENQGSQAWTAGGNCQRLAQTGDHHQRPGTCDTRAEAQQQVRPKPLRPV